MSASERLRELDRADWPTPYFGDEPNAIIHRALPLIADVVEAAETQAEYPNAYYDDPLSLALTALREHLEGQ